MTKHQWSAASLRRPSAQEHPLVAGRTGAAVNCSESSNIAPWVWMLNGGSFETVKALKGSVAGGTQESISDFLLIWHLPDFNLNSYLSHLLCKKYMLTIGKTDQKKKTEMAHTLIVHGLNGANILVYFLPVCFLYNRTVHTSF